ncbi:ergosterol biosynthesis protein [Ascosphaera apis ARSEF 7405]|uniref:Ergosterol biosynthesis protein n=1 Tax=Ascosphaera apis ARSEF 7405 TaxID=392613 RepID=A0A167ZVB6_9EURO|nr:ergosterol biosynthesis protein [Ascosphaera apis ARSEF 7405]
MDYLPQHAGLLPKWLVLVAAVSSINSAQAYASPLYTSLIYNNSPQNPLHSRTFGTWTFLSSVVRCYAGYNINDPLVYSLAMWTYGIALAHFVGEWLLFGSAKAQGRFVSPLFVASGSLLWMWLQRDWYMA